jgi:hypothetical protein
VEITTITEARLLPALAGDFNHDLSVGPADFVLWRGSLGQSGIGLAADGNGDGVVDAADYDVWRENFGASLAGGAIGNAVVPEPTSIVLTPLGALAALLGCRHVLGFRPRRRR